MSVVDSARVRSESEDFAGAGGDLVQHLDIEDLDRRAKVTRKGPAVDIIVWQIGTARLLAKLLSGRTSGPIFLTGRRTHVTLAPGDLDPETGPARLSYRRAEEIFNEVTRPLA
jgi:hypothetical protein